VKPRGSTEVVYEDVASGWAAASSLMHDMLAARQVPYLHVLQPNQYFTTRSFSTEEARIALNPNQPFKRVVELGYPVLTRTGMLLAAKERFLDATTAFDREPGAMYEDDCCHYSDRGNEVLAALIARRILEMK
jgi:hypothetical protein